MLFGKPSKLPDGRYFLKMTHDDGSRVVQQLNNVTLHVSGESVQVNVPQDVFSDIDDTIVQQAKVSKLEWFGKEVSDETVTSAYQKSVNPESELTASFATIKGNVVTVFYDANKNQIQDPVFDQPYDVLVELMGLVFTKRTFEPVWKIIQGRVKSPPKTKFPREYLFKDDEPDEEDVDL